MQVAAGNYWRLKYLQERKKNHDQKENHKAIKLTLKNYQKNEASSVKNEKGQYYELKLKEKIGDKYLD